MRDGEEDAGMLYCWECVRKAEVVSAPECRDKSDEQMEKLKSVLREIRDASNDVEKVTLQGWAMEALENL